MIYAEYPLTDRSAPPAYRGAPRKYGFIDKQTPTDEATLRKIKQECGLFMNVGLLALCLSYLQKQATPTPMEALYLLDSLSALYACRPETQTLAGFDTDDPDHANALSSLICRCRASQKITPPLTLRTVLNAVHDELAASLPQRPHDADPAVHFQLCQAAALAALPAQGYTPLSHLDIGGTSWTLVHHAAHVENASRAARRGDTLCLLHGDTDTPTPRECAAAQALLGEISDQSIRCVMPVEKQTLLPVSLRCVTGLTVNCAAFAKHDSSIVPYPCDLVQNTPGGWLIIAAQDTVEALLAHSVASGLTLTPFGRARSDRVLEFEPRYHGQQVRLSRNLPDAVQIACAYRLTETAAVASPVPVRMAPGCLKKIGFGDCGQFPAAQGLPSWFARSAVLSMESGFDADAVPRAIRALKDALLADGCPALSDASLAIGIEVTPMLSRAVLWQYILDLYHTLQKSALPCLPITLAHKESGPSQLALTLLCRKPYDYKLPVSEQSTEALPLPYCSSAVHTDHPEVLIVHTMAAGSIEGMADTLLRHGGRVKTLRITHGESGCRVLADAVNQARLVLLVGGDPHLGDILTHPDVLSALRSLIERDGLCLAQGDVLQAFCRTGLLPDALTDLPSAPPLDQCSGAFPYPVGAVQSLISQDLAPVLRPLPSSLPCLERDPCPDDPLLTPFRSLQGHPILAITQSSCNHPLAVRLRGQDGHILLYADGFDATQLQGALDYCR